MDFKRLQLIMPVLFMLRLYSFRGGRKVVVVNDHVQICCFRTCLSRYASFPISMRGTHPMVCDVRVLAAICPTIRKGAFENVSDRTAWTA